MKCKFQILPALYALFFFGALGVSPVQAMERTWSRATQQDTSFVTLYSENNVFKIKQVREVPGRLPVLISSMSFNDKSSALQAIEPYLQTGFKRVSRADLLAHQPISANTEVTGSGLWKVTESWSWAWEQKYAQWVETEAGPDFYVRNQIKTDCADVAYSLRWIFARIYGLPAANHLSGSGVLFTQDSMKKEWLHLSTASDWRKDERFLAALEYVLELTYTHTLIRDSYPIAITPESLISGAHHLQVRTESGHTMVVYNTDLSDTSTEPVTMMFSNVPRIVRPLYVSGYWQINQPKPADGGFLRILWPVQSAQGWKLLAPKLHPHYSTEEYSADFMQGHASFAEAVLLRLNPKLDFRARLADGIIYLEQQIGERDSVISAGVKICTPSPDACAPGTDNYENFSTTSRDQRLLDTFQQLEDLVSALSTELDKFSDPWNLALSQNVLQLGTQNYTLGQVELAWKAHTFSSDPRVSIDNRWGMTPASFVHSLATSVSSLLATRTQRIGEQADACSKTGACAPGSDDGLKWNTFDLESSLSDFMDDLAQYCSIFSMAQCQAMETLATQEKVAQLSLNDWQSKMPWLISDPRVSTAARWGSQQSQYKNSTIGSASHFDVSKNGVGYSCIQPGPVLPPCALWEIWDVAQQKRKYLPQGSDWVAYDKVHDWSVAVSSAQGLPRSVSVYDINGNVLFSRSYAQLTHSPQWISPGVLLVVEGAAEGAAMDLIDLTLSPAFEASGLALATFSDFGKGRWFSNNPDGSSLDFFSYSSRSITHKTLSDGLNAMTRIEEISGEAQGILFGNAMNCPQHSCTNFSSFDDAFAFGLNIQTGEVTKIGSPQQVFSPTYDGQSGVLFSFVDDHMLIEEVMLDRHLKITTSKTLEEGFPFSVLNTHDRLGKDITYASISPDGAHFVVAVYQDGTWQSAPLLGDEQSVVDVSQGYMITSLTQGGQRVREILGPKSLFEALPGDTLQLTEGSDISQQAGVWMNSPGNAQMAFYLLASPSQPLLTAKPIIESPEAFVFKKAYWTTHGLMMRVGKSRSLWLDI
jgi:hypothetical protein